MANFPVGWQDADAYASKAAEGLRLGKIQST
jgi:hypothetical protein